MSLCSLVIISQDRALLSELDEPLQRDNYRAELLPNIRSWQMQQTSGPCSLLVLDLESLDRLLTKPLLEEISHRSQHVLVITGDQQKSTRNVPEHWTTCRSRSGGALLARIHTLLGEPGRLFVRTPFNCDITIRHHEQGAIVAKSCDLSHGGVFVESLQPLRAGDRIVVHFDGLCFSSDGYVAWKRTFRHGRQPLHGAGVQFLFPDRPKLRQILDSHPH